MLLGTKVATRSLFSSARAYAGAATTGSAPNQFNVFDRKSKKIQRSKAPVVDIARSRKVEYLRDEVATRTIERLAFITRDMTKVLDFGSNAGNFVKNLCTDTELPENPTDEDKFMVQQLNDDKKNVREKISELVMVDSCAEMLHRDAGEDVTSGFPGTVVRHLVDDEESALNNKSTTDPVLALDQYDAVISNLSLHWINDLPGTLANINRVLKPDGLFMGTIIGGDTLYELRTSLQLAELERKGGMSPRVSPLVHLNDVGSLLNRAGFSMLTIDSEDIVVGGFPDIVALMEDLQFMGEQNSVLSRPTFLPKDVLMAANQIYTAMHGEEGEDGVVTLPATFSVIFVIGWKKSESQPQPLKRGSAQVSLKDVL